MQACRTLGLLVLGSFLLLQSKLAFVVSSDRSQSRVLDRDVHSRKVVFKFTTDGAATLCHFKDPHFGLIKIGVPRFMKSYSGDRVALELNHYLDSNHRWSQRVLLERLYYALTYGTDYKPAKDIYPDYPCLQNRKNWLKENVDVCDWEGITCGDIHPSESDRPRVELKLFGKIDEPYSWGPSEKYIWPDRTTITKIDLPEYQCRGTLPDEMFMLTELRRFDLHDNRLHGTIPASYGEFVNLDYLDLSFNELTGRPWQLSHLTKNLQELWLGNNLFEGPIQFYLAKMMKLHLLDVSHNKITGTIPNNLYHHAQLIGLFIDNNNISGTIPTEMGVALTNIQYLFLYSNNLNGTIPTELGLMSNLRYLALDQNALTGTLPCELTNLDKLEEISVAENLLTGPISAGDFNDERLGCRWSNMRQLSRFDLHNNRFGGTFPSSFLLGLKETLAVLDVGFNDFSGTVPPELGRMKELNVFSAPSNKFTGSLPFELGRLSDIQVFNLTANQLKGTIPLGLCNFVNGIVPVINYGCDAVLCPHGTFHPNGAADHLGACRVCEQSSSNSIVSSSNYLGQTQCEGTTFLIGDANGDGIQSAREILHYFYIQNGGMNWGAKFRDWLDTTIPDCELPGVTCLGDEIAKLDLSDAAICSDVDGGEGPRDECHGIPAELSLLSYLEVLSMPRRRFLIGSIPTEIGLLSRLRFLDLSHCPQLRGTIPTEIGALLKLKVLNFANSQFSGTIPSELFSLPNLEKLDLGMNSLTGSLPNNIGCAKSLEEMLLSRLDLNTTIPTTIGELTNLDNVELYGCNIKGTIPSEIGKCTALKRLDLFNNRLTGTIPSTLAQIEGLQIIHLKKNHLTGPLPEEIGNLQFLTWIDVSFNMISGTIPPSYGHIRTLKDLRLGGNRLHNPIPQSLCASVQINGGRTRSFGCDGILCPLGYYDAAGFAFDANDSCTKCPSGTTTIYLGSPECIELHVEDILSMLYEVMGGDLWDQDDVSQWNTDVNICRWNGVVCEDDGTLVSISLPLTRATDPLGDTTPIYDALNHRSSRE